MSTFGGFVKEFPRIRIDYFRTIPGRPPPIACFLSHVHSDHLVGLESLKAPFVWCSSATRELLLRIEKYPHRMNFAKGILEARRQHYRHLKNLLKPLPLNTPTELELRFGETIRVTLLDANHCPGAVMFLIEGDGKAILYTGDIRAESWWVNSIVRNPAVVPFTFGLKKLTTMYLDTTFAAHDDVYRTFPSKAEGLVELLRKINDCPKDTIFYFRAWTLGYEDVWIALAAALNTTVHVDAYQTSLLRSTSQATPNAMNSETASLSGYFAGNTWIKGCLSTDPGTKLHSCEPGLECHSRISKQDNVVWIAPIISRLGDGTEVLELGAGGGWRDFHQTLELEHNDDTASAATLQMCQQHLQDQNNPEEALEQFKVAWRQRRLPIEGFSSGQHRDITIDDFFKTQANMIMELTAQHPPRTMAKARQQDRVLHFPYSRHSSHQELRDLVSRFEPEDICPCTVDIDSWTDDLSMESLFGDLCPRASSWYYDASNRTAAKAAQEEKVLLGKRKRDVQDDNSQDTQDTTTDQDFISAPASFKGLQTEAKEPSIPGASPKTPQKATPDVPALTTPVSAGISAISPPATVKESSPEGITESFREAVKTHFRALNGGSDWITRSGRFDSSHSQVAPRDMDNQAVRKEDIREEPADKMEASSHVAEEGCDTTESQLFLRTSAFESQPPFSNDHHKHQEANTAIPTSPHLQLDGSQGESSGAPASPANHTSSKTPDHRTAARKHAYRIAQRVMLGDEIGSNNHDDDGDPDRDDEQDYKQERMRVGTRGEAVASWEALGSTRTWGRQDHSVDEVELGT